MKADQTSSPRIIDAHAQLGAEYPFTLDAAELLRKMDDAGVAIAVARPVGAELVVDNRAGNDRVLGGGQRIKAWITANPWFGSRALDEMKRCRDAGAVGLFLHPARQGFSPIEPVAEPLLRLAASWRWPVMFHTGTYIYADILAVGEMARRLPETPMVLGNAGFTDMWFELPGVFAEVKNLWLDTSMIWSAAIDQIVSAGGGDRVLFAGGEPRNRYSVVLKAIARHDLAPELLDAVLHGNARRLLGL